MVLVLEFQKLFEYFGKVDLSSRCERREQKSGILILFENLYLFKSKNLKTKVYFHFFFSLPFLPCNYAIWSLEDFHSMENTVENLWSRSNEMIWSMMFSIQLKKRSNNKKYKSLKKKLKTQFLCVCFQIIQRRSSAF